MNKFTLIMWTQAIIGIIMLLLGVYFLSISKTDFKINKVKCYDKFSNEIIGLECEEKMFIHDSYDNWGFGLVFFGTFVCVFSTLWSEMYNPKPIV